MLCKNTILQNALHTVSEVTLNRQRVYVAVQDGSDLHDLMLHLNCIHYNLCYNGLIGSE